MYKVQIAKSVLSDLVCGSPTVKKYGLSQIYYKSKKLC